MMKTYQFQILCLHSSLLLICVLLISCLPQIMDKNSDGGTSVTTTVSITPENPPVLKIKQSAQPSRTPEYTNTFTQVSTITPDVLQSLISSRYIVINDYNQRILLVDIETGDYRLLKVGDIDPVKVLSLSDDGCELIVKLRDNSIVKVDLQGNITKVLLSSSRYLGKENIIIDSVSPSGDWLAYFVGQGSRGYNNFEKQDLEILNLENQDNFPLTEGGGAWTIAWSNDGEWIAYSDFDKNNINQIYISREDGKEKLQLTSFLDPNNLISLLRWSPEDDKLAFQLYNQIDQSTSFGVILIQGHKGFVKTFPGVPSIIRNFWWQDNNVIAIQTISDDKENTQDMDGIIWIRVGTGTIIDILKESETPDHTIVSANFFDNSTIVFFSDRGFYTYELRDKTVRRNFDSYFNYSEWSISPLAYPGEENCQLNR